MRGRAAVTDARADRGSSRGFGGRHALPRVIGHVIRSAITIASRLTVDRVECDPAISCVRVGVLIDAAIGVGPACRRQPFAVATAARTSSSARVGSSLTVGVGHIAVAVGNISGNISCNIGANGRFGRAEAGLSRPGVGRRGHRGCGGVRSRDGPRIGGGVGVLRGMRVGMFRHEVSFRLIRSPGAVAVPSRRRRSPVGESRRRASTLDEDDEPRRRGCDRYCEKRGGWVRRPWQARWPPLRAVLDRDVRSLAVDGRGPTSTRGGSRA